MYYAFTNTCSFTIAKFAEVVGLGEGYSSALACCPSTLDPQLWWLLSSVFPRANQRQEYGRRTCFARTACFDSGFVKVFQASFTSFLTRNSLCSIGISLIVWAMHGTLYSDHVLWCKHLRHAPVWQSSYLTGCVINVCWSTCIRECAYNLCDSVYVWPLQIDLITPNLYRDFSCSKISF